MNRRKLTGVVASLVVAALGTVILLKSVNSDVKAAVPVPVEPTVSVLKVVKPIPKGALADTLGDSVTVAQVRVSERLADTVEAPAAIAGMVAAQELYPNEQIVRARFVSPVQAAAEEEAANPSPETSGLIGVWVALEPLQAMNGKIKTNSSVAVFATLSGVTPIRDNPGEPSPLNPSSSLIIHKAIVLDCIGCEAEAPVAGAVPVPAPAPADPAAAGAVPVAPTMISVKLGVDAPAAERLVFSAKYGSLWLGSEDPFVVEANTKVIDRSNVYVPTPNQVPKRQGDVVSDTPETTVVQTTVVQTTVPTTKPAPVTAPASAAAASVKPVGGPAVPAAGVTPVATPVSVASGSPAATVAPLAGTPAQ
jgi:pilus assembly protein CpaB